MGENKREADGKWHWWGFDDEYAMVSDPFDTPKAALRSIAEEMKADLASPHPIYSRLKRVCVGVQTPLKFKSIMCADHIIEDWQEAAEDCGIGSGDFLHDVTEEEKDELEGLIADWMRRHDHYPWWFSYERERVIDIKFNQGSLEPELWLHVYSYGSGTRIRISWDDPVWEKIEKGEG